MRSIRTRVLLFTMILLGTTFNGLAAAQTCPPPPNLPPPCAPAITNRDCIIVIDRDSASTPLPVKLTRSATVTLIVHKRLLDVVTADATFTDIATPDPVAALFAAFSPNFKSIKFTESTRGLVELLSLDTTKAVVADRARPLLAQLKWIHEQQVSLQDQLKQSKKLADAAAEATKKFLATPTATTCKWMDADLTSALNVLKGPLQQAVDMDTGSGLAKGLREATDGAAKAYAKLAENPTSENLAEIGRVLNAIVSLQAEIDASSTSLVAAATSARETVKAVDALKIGDLVHQQSFRGAGRSNRSASIKVKAEDARKKAIELGTVNLVWAETRWEVSAGAVFSALPNRTFQNTVQIVDGQIQLTPDGKPNTSITETTTRPSIVPFGLAHYRLGETARYDRRWAVLATGGMGISPYSGSTDFAAGITIAYRSLFISPVAHFARDTRLTSGLKTGDSLGAGPPPLPTERFWKTSFGICVTARVF